MKIFSGVILGICSVLMGCISTPGLERNLQASGHWVVEANGQVMLNPQTSGLVNWRGGLMTLSDRSADPSQRLRLRTINQQNATLTSTTLTMVLAERLRTHCFAPYVSDNPDLEALAVDPDDDEVFYVVTEDASYAEPMSAACQQKYLNSGSTTYPTLLIRLELQANDTVLITHIRPIQFAADMQIGDFPNDGVEALAFGQARTLYLGLEKDSQNQARIFSLKMHERFWHTDDYAAVSKFAVKLPRFESGSHPINGMDYYQTADGREFLLVAARNDEALWVVDLSGQNETVILEVDFFAQIKNNSQGCVDYEAMNNASIEGVAVVDDTVWLINDPWKAVYLKNVVCPQNRSNYEVFAPLLFSVPIQPRWFN